MKMSVLLVVGMCLLTSCSTPLSRVATERRFNEEAKADIVVRYYSDQTSYVLKPKQMEGPFLSILTKNAVVELAKGQPHRDLAVVVMIYYTEDNKRVSVKREWRDLLREVGFQRVVFLRAVPGMKINGLSILEDEVELTQSPRPEHPANLPAGQAHPKSTT